MYAVVGTPKYFILESPAIGVKPIYWHRAAPFNVPKWYILNRTFPTPETPIGGGWFNPPDPGLYDPERYYNHKAIKKDDKDFLNILIMAIKGIDKL